MKNIQAQYQDLLEGKMSMTNFMRNVRMQFPQHISPTTSFDDSVKILKGKRILSEVKHVGVVNEVKIDGKEVKNFKQNGDKSYSVEFEDGTKTKVYVNHDDWDILNNASKEKLNEAKKPIGVYGHNPNAEAEVSRGIDHLNYYQVYHGIQYELAKMPEITDENYVKARKKVVDTILKNPDAYKQLQLANFKAVKEMDEDLEMKEVKKNNLKDKPNEMKVVKKDEKGNTQDTLEKKEKKKAKNGKGLQHMTQTPKGKLEAFATPGKEKVMALKEHIIDEMTTPNPHHEDFHKGMEVHKKKGRSGPGKIIEFDGHTATVQWEDGSVEDLQKNVITKQPPAAQTTPSENPFSKMPDLGKLGQDWLSKQNKEELDEDPVGQQAAGNPEDEAEMRASQIKKESKIKALKEKLATAVKEILYKNKKTGQIQSFDINHPEDKDTMKDPQFNQVFQKA